MSTTITKTPETNRTSEVQYRRPLYSIHSLDGAYEVRVMVPGCSKEGIQISLEHDVLSIQASRKGPLAEDWKQLHREVVPADFRLKLNLNVNIAADRISAKTEDGVLTLNLPVAEEAKPRQITVE
jgi:HSP20 family protein